MLVVAFSTASIKMALPPGVSCQPLSLVSAAERNFTETAGLKLYAFFQVLLPTSCPILFFLLPGSAVISWSRAALERNSCARDCREMDTSPNESRAGKP